MEKRAKFSHCRVYDVRSRNLPLELDLTDIEEKLQKVEGELERVRHLSVRPKEPVQDGKGTRFVLYSRTGCMEDG